MKKNTIHKFYPIELPKIPRTGETVESIQELSDAKIYPRVPERIARANMETIDTYEGEF